MMPKIAARLKLDMPKVSKVGVVCGNDLSLPGIVIKTKAKHISEDDGIFEFPVGIHFFGSINVDKDLLSFCMSLEEKLK